jgi:CheY-like chemotaxis protein
MILEEDYHAVILDVMMQKIDGFEVLKQLRKESDIPVLMLTARREETDRIVGILSALFAENLISDAWLQPFEVIRFLSRHWDTLTNPGNIGGSKSLWYI